MATLYIEHGKYPAYAATPGWGLCQEGDGLVNGLAVSAIGSVLFSAFDNTTGSIGVLGVTLTPVFGTSANAQADSLAGLINGSATAVNATTTPNGTQLRDLVYARGPTNGAPAGTCQIMTRAGTANLNSYATAITSSLNGTVPTLTQFTGGVSGSWGYFVNTAVLWPSAKAVANYGLLWAKPLMGDATAGDTVNIRTSLAGAPIFLTLAISANPPNMRAFGVASPVKFVFNSNNAWSETTGRLTIQYSPNGQIKQNRNVNTLGGGRAVGNYYMQGGICTTDNEPNFGFEIYPNVSQASILLSIVSVKDRWERTFFSIGDRSSSTVGSATSSSTNCFTMMADGNNVTYPLTDLVTMDSVLFVIKQANTGNINNFDNTQFYGIEFNNCTVKALGVSNIPAPYGLFSLGAYISYPNAIYIRNLITTGVPAGSRLFYVNSTYPGKGKVIVEDTSLLNLEGTQGSIIDGTSEGNFEIMCSSSSAGFPFLLEALHKSIYWIPAKGQPTLNATTPDGIAMSWVAQISTNSEFVNSIRPIALPKMGLFNVLDVAARTVKINFLADRDKTITSDDVYAVVTYTDNTLSTVKSITSKLQVATSLTEVTNLTPDWSQTKNDGTGNILPYMNIIADRFYKRYQLALTTPTTAQKNSTITVQIYITSKSATNSERFIFCPEVLVS